MRRGLPGCGILLVEERFTLTNNSRFPAIWVEIIDETNMPNYWSNQVRGIGSNSETRWLVRSVCSQRGLYVLGPTTLRTKDPFGFFTVTRYDPASTTMMVVPPTVLLPEIQVATGGRSGERVAQLNTPERTVSSSSVRQYVPGDSLRWIHWPTSARKSEFFVRIYDSYTSGDWWIILDLHADVQIGQGKDSTVEHGIILAASMANLAMRNGISVGLIAYGDEMIWLAPNMSDDHNWDILKSLAVIKAGDCQLSELIRLVRPGLSKNTSAIIITPSTNGDWIQLILELQNHQVVPTVLLFDPETFGSTKSITPLKNDLVELGVLSEIIPKELLAKEEIDSRKQDDLDWIVTPLGRAVPRIKPEALIWHNISGHDKGKL